MFGWEKAPTARGTGKRGNVSFTHSPKPLPSFGVLKESRQVRNSAEAPRDVRSLTLPSLKAWGFSLLRESLESTELHPDTFPDLFILSELFSG
ncbi:MAG: hypothetical protein BRC39_14010 [Cyanobacteria bacterium QH_7_48_89]|nr:MAG: hypothetical protein BRC39_14010 [Cyanobacteria bacterium QH_7_48_89]